jgi:CPA1 family monovalent cation:H+ antiporter
LFLFLFLPPLLFSDGWRMPKRDFWRFRGPILTMAVGLVIFTVVGAGYFILWLLPSVPLAVAFALAAVLSPTDAVAVSAIAQDRLPAPIMRLLQGEALMNDATGLVTFKFALAASLTFVLVACGGLAVGVGLSWLVGRFRSWMIARGWDDPATHVVFMLLLPFAAYVVAERLEVSGILSAVAAGMMQSWVDLLPRQTSTRLLNRSVWTLLEFAFNGLIFLLLGLQLRRHSPRGDGLANAALALPGCAGDLRRAGAAALRMGAKRLAADGAGSPLAWARGRFAGVVDARLVVADGGRGTGCGDVGGYLVGADADRSRCRFP